MAESTPTQPWEQQVASCLHVMCAEPNSAALAHAVMTMVELFCARKPLPGYAVFRARLGLSVATLAAATGPETAYEVLARTAEEAIDAADGYAARDVLGYRDGPTNLTDRHRQRLTRLVTASGLGSGAMPKPLYGSLVGATGVASRVLAESVSTARLKDDGITAIEPDQFARRPAPRAAATDDCGTRRRG